MFAVIKTGGKQYRVAANDLLKVEKLAGNAGDIVEFGQVLAFGEGDSATIGAPLRGRRDGDGRSGRAGPPRTVIAFKKRRRQNSRRKLGHRQHETTVRIDEILTGGAKPSKKAAAKPRRRPSAEGGSQGRGQGRGRAKPQALADVRRRLEARQGRSRQERSQGRSKARRTPTTSR